MLTNERAEYALAFRVGFDGEDAWHCRPFGPVGSVRLRRDALGHPMRKESARTDAAGIDRKMRNAKDFGRYYRVAISDSLLDVRLSSLI
jgi:hypothetical protein